MEFLRGLFSPGDYMPHGYCYMWNTGLVLLHALSDSAIFIAYMSIPLILAYIVYRRRDVPFHWMFLCFGVFIVSCGLTHGIEVWNLWHSRYWIAGIVKAVTAFASVGTAVILIRITPRALTLPNLTELRNANALLKQQSAALRASEENVRKLNQDLMRRTQQIESVNRELEAFNYSVSHDLRTPLRHIDGYTRILLEEHGNQLNSDGKYCVQKMLQGAARMNALVEDLLNLSRIGRSNLNRHLADLGPLVRTVIDEFSADISGRKVTWQVQPLPQVVCDPGLMKIVFANLLSNALKFTRTREEAVIQVGAEFHGDAAALFVRDNGVGFDPNHAEKLFGAFQRLHHQHEFEGTGIGLATVYRIVQKHGGRLWAESKLDGGATFYFTLETSPVTDSNRHGKPAEEKWLNAKTQA